MLPFPSHINVPPALQAALVTAWSNITKNPDLSPYLNTEFSHTLARILSSSPFVTAYLLKQPSWLPTALSSADLLMRYLPQEMSEHVRASLRDAVTVDAFMLRLRQVRQREMVRIAWRDIAGWASVDETLADLSALADACLQETTHFAHQRLVFELGEPLTKSGQPQTLVIIAMGKLGAYELNFSSDIDLIFAYPESGHETFFIRLARQVIKIIDTQTEAGFVFRVDVRLRPYGDSGPLLLSYAGMTHYYQGTAREWERYAMVKARVVVGDAAAHQHFAEMMQPFVYRRYIDYSAITSLRDMKAMITTEAQRKGIANSIKLGAGGIREVEFIGQVFQLIRGGREPTLQIKPILGVLQALQALHILSPTTVSDLTVAYHFLRRTENHLQMIADQQTHRLPDNDNDLWRLSLSMGFPQATDFLTALNAHRAIVTACFQDIFAGHQAPPQDAWYALWMGTEQQDTHDWGYFKLERLRPCLADFRATRAYRVMSKAGQAHLQTLIPRLLKALSSYPLAGQYLTRFLRFLETIAGRLSYLSLIAENKTVQAQLFELGIASHWIIDLLTRFPLLLDELLDQRRLYHPPDRAGLETEINILLSKIEADDLEQQMETIRQFVQANKLRIAAADVTDALPLMVVSDQLSLVAEVTLQAVTRLSWHSLAQNNPPPDAEFGIIAYGKLGGLELSYGSDLDIVFVYEGTENQAFYARLGQKIIHFLQTPLASGAAYEIDTRLRPHGESGLLVIPLDHYATYQHEEAWTWEHQALVRARMVVGGAAMVAKFETLRANIVSQQRQTHTLRTDVMNMREKMREQLGQKDPSQFQLKHDTGGIADIEFIVQYGVLCCAHEHPELLRYTDNIRLLAYLPKTGLLSKTQAERLAEAFRAYRSVVHLHALNHLPAQVDATTFAMLRVDVINIWQHLFQPGADAYQQPPE